uniref:Crystallin, beta A1a n=1 Tax=Electrophorus electricus TaxID=8005 RepID=A0A4W4F566_ELEEL
EHTNQILSVCPDCVLSVCSVCVLSVQVTVYDQGHFQGKRMEFSSSCQNIMECGLDNIRSLKVESGTWVGYEHSSFCGQQFILEKGNYPCWEAWSGSHAYHVERLTSFRPLCCADHKESKIAVCEKENFTGRQWEISDDYPSLPAMGWPSIASCLFLWVCYQYPGYRGHQYILECDRHGGNYKHYRDWGSHHGGSWTRASGRVLWAGPAVSRWPGCCLILTGSIKCKKSNSSYSVCAMAVFL